MGTEEEWMRLAIAEAKLSLKHDDIPIGALVISVSYTHLTLPTKRIV